MLSKKPAGSVRTDVKTHNLRKAAKAVKRLKEQSSPVKTAKEMRKRPAASPTVKTAKATPTGARAAVTDESGEEEMLSKAAIDALPADAPEGHAAWTSIRWSDLPVATGGQRAYCVLQAKGSDYHFQTTRKACSMSRYAAQRIARACYVKGSVKNCSKEKVIEFRNSCYSRFNAAMAEGGAASAKVSSGTTAGDAKPKAAKGTGATDLMQVAKTVQKKPAMLIVTKRRASAASLRVAKALKNRHPIMKVMKNLKSVAPRKRSPAAISEQLSSEPTESHSQGESAESEAEQPVKTTKHRNRTTNVRQVEAQAAKQSRRARRGSARENGNMSAAPDSAIVPRCPRDDSMFKLLGWLHLGLNLKIGEEYSLGQMREMCKGDKRKIERLNKLAKDPRMLCPIDSQSSKPAKTTKQYFPQKQVSEKHVAKQVPEKPRPGSSKSTHPARAPKRTVQQDDGARTMEDRKAAEPSPRKSRRSLRQSEQQKVRKEEAEDDMPLVGFESVRGILKLDLGQGVFHHPKGDKDTEKRSAKLLQKLHEKPRYISSLPPAVVV